MTVRNLEYLFRPKSVAVVGASDVPGSYGAVVLRNLMGGGFGGPILPVTLKHPSLFGLATHPRVEKLPFAPDLAVLCTAAEAVPEVVSQLGARGTRAVILACPLPAQAKDPQGRPLLDAVLAAARPHLMRLLGPSSAGVVLPRLGLNASFAHAPVALGRTAFVSQSAPVTAAVLDWARSRGIGFSCLLHLGDSADVDLADVLDYLASDPGTASILLHFESVAQGRKFMSAARAAARNKPVVAIRPGRFGAGSRVGTTQAAALLESDDVYAAAMPRAGIVRVFTSEGLFEAVEAVARARPTAGDRLAIVANGAGFGRVAADVLQDSGGHLARVVPQCAAELRRQLGAVTPANPLELATEAPAADYARACRTLLACTEVDAVLAIHAPTVFAAAADVANALAEAAQGATRSVFTCWLGGDAVQEGRRIASERGLPSYDAPEKAVDVFLGIEQYRRNRELLMQMPPSVPEEFVADALKARRLVAHAIERGRDRLTEREARAVLAAYRIPVLESPTVRTLGQAVAAADALGYPVTLRLHAARAEGGAEQTFRTRDVATAAELRSVARELRSGLRERLGELTLRGYSVQPSVPRPGALEFMVGVASDPVFGPVVMAGRGGSTAAGARDLAVGLPPLNMLLARDLISRSRAALPLVAGSDAMGAGMDALCLTLVQVSQLVSDLDEVEELEIDPLLVDARGVLAREVRIRVVPHRRRRGVRRFAIRPYPRELENRVEWQGRSVLLRPIRPEDEAAHGMFLESLLPEDARYRFFSTMRHLPHTELARYTHIDYDREMAFVALGEGPDGQPGTLGEVRAVADPDNVSAEFAIVVRSELKGKGLGRLLLDRMIAYLRDRGTRELRGETMPDNERMKNLARDCGFAITPRIAAGIVELRLGLNSEPRS